MERPTVNSRPLKTRSYLEILALSICGGLIVALVTLAASYVNHRCEPRVCPQRYYGMTYLLERCQRLVRDFQKNNGRLPQSLDEVPNVEHWNTDPWGRVFLYRPLENGQFELGSFGRDGVPSGTGPDADFGTSGSEDSCLTWRQFFLSWNETEIATRGFLALSIAAGLFTVVACFVQLRSRSSWRSASLKSFFLQAAVLVAMATAFGLMLLPVEIPSGH